VRFENRRKVSSQVKKNLAPVHRPAMRKRRTFTQAENGEGRLSPPGEKGNKKNLTVARGGRE